MAHYCLFFFYRGTLLSPLPYVPIDGSESTLSLHHLAPEVGSRFSSKEWQQFVIHEVQACRLPCSAQSPLIFNVRRPVLPYHRRSLEAISNLPGDTWLWNCSRGTLVAIAWASKLAQMACSPAKDHAPSSTRNLRFVGPIKGERPQLSCCTPFVSTHGRHTRRSAMIKPPYESEDFRDLPEGNPPFLFRHPAIGLPPFMNTLGPDLASLSLGTKRNSRETLLHRRTSISLSAPKHVH
ncbi:hypothetical protein EI94DRAFT_994193 [Lactarius quietus]|nr:hypothetical protein EI94DRAFT_994193 [Lactarius quietus]